MKFSKLFTKTNKDSKEFDSINATYLIKGGFIDQTMAGVYSFLPLGLRVLQKIERIIREEMDEIGSEVLLPSLSPKEIWEQTNRLEIVDVLFKTGPANDLSKNKNDAEYILNPTQEEIITPIAKKFNISYRDLPKAAYQIQTKFRNEARPKSGLLRGREFRMKDLYSFHKSEAGLKEYYEEAKNAYKKVYERLGISDITYIALASGGDFTKDYSHEFQTKCETGEDLLFHNNKSGITYNKEIAPSKIPTPNKKEDLLDMEEVETKGIISVQALVDFMQVPIEKTVKTIIYNADDSIVAVGLRGDYDVNELKLQKILDCKNLSLASEEQIKKHTGAEVGYAGLIGLSDEVKVIVDDSLENLHNFECGANKTNYHFKNVNWTRDLKKPEKFEDIKEAKEGDLDPHDNEKYEVFKACEVGNIFPLNTKFSEAFNYTYSDENGEQHYVYMGCYGIGPTRLMGVIVETFHDDRGIIWPENIAPFQVHLIGLNLEQEDVEKRAQEIYKKLTDKNIEVLFDDRTDVSAGEKFADADLIGCPHRILVSKKTEKNVEYKFRSNNEKGSLITLEELFEKIK